MFRLHNKHYLKNFIVTAVFPKRADGFFLKMLKWINFFMKILMKNVLFLKISSPEQAKNKFLKTIDFYDVKIDFYDVKKNFFPLCLKFINMCQKLQESWQNCVKTHTRHLQEGF